MLSIRISPDTEKRFNDLAQRTGRTKTDHAHEAILRYIEDLEDESLALEVMRHPGRRYTMEEVRKKLGLEH